MKLTTSQTALLKVLAHVQRIVERKNTIPILAHVRLTADHGALIIDGTDLDIAARGDCPATIERPGAVTVPAAMFYDIVRKVGPSDISLDLDQEMLIVRSGRARFQIQTLPAADFPDLSAGEMTHSFEADPDELQHLIEKTQFAISTEETRYYLNGIYLHRVENPARLRAVATDGHRLARVDTDAPDGSEEMPSIIVPRKTVGEIAKLLKEHDERHGKVSIELSSQKIRLVVAGIAITSKLIDGTFPDYERVIPQGNGNEIVVQTSTLRAAVERVSTVEDENGRAVKMAIEDGKITLTMRTASDDQGTEDIDADTHGTEIEIGFNGRYLADLLGHPGGDVTLIKLGDPGSPALFMSHDGANAIFLLMPMRV